MHNSLSREARMGTYDRATARVRASISVNIKLTAEGRGKSRPHG